MSRILIVGCGGHGRSVADVVVAKDPQTEIVFYDENARENEQLLDGHYSTYSLDTLNPDSQAEKIFIAVGDNIKRKKYFQIYNKQIVSIVSKYSYVSKFARLGKGCFVGNFAHIGPEAVVGEGCIINTSAVIEHEVICGDYTHVSVNSTVCGRCVIGNNVFIGAGATIRDGISICDDVVIGANSVVVKNIDRKGVYVGVPAKKLR